MLVSLPLFSEAQTNGSILESHISSHVSLHQACKEGNLGIVKYIVQHNQENIDSLDKLGQTPLMVAALFGKVDVFNYLLPHSNKLTMINENRNNILHLAAKGGSVTIVKRVLSLHVVSIESREHSEKTPVLMAARFGHREVLELLVDEGCNIKAVDGLKNNVLHLACVNGNLNTVSYILSKDFVDIDSKGYREQTPIMFAALHGHIHIFDFLLKKGCNVQLVNVRNENTLHLACVYRKDIIVKYILFHDIFGTEIKGLYGRTPIMAAAYSGCTKCFDLLLSKGSDLNAHDNFKNSILHWACFGGHVYMIKYIQFHGNMSLNVTHPDGFTLLMAAVWEGRLEALKFLLSKGADVKAIDQKGKNVLHYACERRMVEIVKYLLKLNLVDLNQKDRLGRTSLQFAKERGYNEIVRLFITHPVSK